MKNTMQEKPLINIQKLLKDPTDNLLIQMFRYLFVGGLAFVVDFSLLFVLTDVFGLYYLLSAVISFIFGLTVNYLLSVNWVFNRRRLENRYSELVIFVIIGVIGLALTSVFLWMFTELFHIYYLLSKIVTTAIVLIWNFGARKIILFPSAG